MKIAVTDPGGLHPDLNFLRSGRKNFHHFKSKRLISLIENSGEGLHGFEIEMMMGD